MSTAINERPEAHHSGSELQSMIADSVARLFEDHVTPALLLDFEQGNAQNKLWDLVRENGLSQALLATGGGEESPTFSDVYPLFHALGYWQAPIPLLETLIGNYFLSQAGIELPQGAGTIALPGQKSLTLSRSGDTWTLDGAVKKLPWASASQWLLTVDPETRHVVLFDLKQAQPGAVQVTAGRNVAGEPRDSVSFNGLAATAAGQGGDARALLIHLALARSIAIVGALECALNRSVQYVTERVQFGRPLAKFQAIQHSLADMAGQVASAKMAAQVAANTASGWAGGADDLTRLVFDTAIAKVRAGEAATRAAWIAHQLHGAIGFTEEHALHFATKRLWAWRSEYGSDAWWAERLGKAAIKAGSQKFWPALTSRSLALDV